MKGEIADKIVYTLTSAPGGVDGRDPKDKGGRILFASFDKVKAEKKKGSDTRYILKAVVVDTTERRKLALKKLDPIDKLIMGWN